MISMSKTMKIMATRKNFTGKRSGVSLVGTMPHSYAARLALVGLRGARRPDAMKLPAAKSTASPNSISRGRYWPSTRYAAFSNSARRAMTSLSRSWSM